MSAPDNNSHHARQPSASAYETYSYTCNSHPLGASAVGATTITANPGASAAAPQQPGSQARAQHIKPYGYSAYSSAGNYHQQQKQPQYQYHYSAQDGVGGLYGAPPPPPQTYQATTQLQPQPAYAPPHPPLPSSHGIIGGAPHFQGYHQSNAQQYASTTLPPPPPPPPPPSSQRSNQNQEDTTSKIDKNEIEISDCSPPRDHKEQDNPCAYQCPNCPNATFTTEKALRGHMAAHITCRHEGCSYTASKGLVNAHFTSVHGKFAGRGLKTVCVAVPGLRVQKFKICVGNHPEDIKAWISERKKRFPTRERVQKKGDVEARKRAEGALSATIDGSSRPGVKRKLDKVGVSATGGRSNQDLSYQASRKKSKADGATTSKEEDAKAIDGGLASLLGGYGSSSSSDDDEQSTGEIEENPTISDSVNNTSQQQEQQQQNPFYRTRPCRFYLRTGRCRNGENCNYLHEDGEARRSAEEQRIDQSKRDKARSGARRDVERLNSPRSNRQGGGRDVDDYKYADPGPKAPLLRKLLQNDIRRERSLALQLLRYIVDCNYLQEKREEVSAAAVAGGGGGGGGNEED